MLATGIQSIFVALAMTCGAQALADESSERSEWADQIRKLGPLNPQKVRLETVRWFIKNAERAGALDAMPALAACVKDDTHPMVRGKAAEALGLIANRQKPKVCPPAIVEAFEDKDEEVRQLATGVSGLFTDFAPGSKGTLLRCLKDGDRDVRCTVVSILARAWGKDREIVRVIRAATEDKDFALRHNARCALFQATGRLEDIVPHCLAVRLKYGNLPDVPPSASDKERFETAHKRLISLSALGLIHLQGEKRPDEVSKLVAEQLESRNPEMRRAAVVFIAEYADELKAAKENYPDWYKALQTEDADNKQDKSPKLVERWRQMKVGERIRRLTRDDPAPEVQAAASAAIKRLVTPR